MEETKMVEKKNEKMSYEELENVAAQLSQQSQQLYARLQQAEMSNMFKRLDLLFKVVENAHAFNEAFVAKCVKEIEDIMTIPDESQEDINTEE